MYNSGQSLFQKVLLLSLVHIMLKSRQELLVLKYIKPLGIVLNVAKICKCSDTSTLFQIVVTYVFSD
jgi:hypothetical protein